jgi:hypothetical protein
MTPWTVRDKAILAAGVALYVVLAVSSLRQKSATFDEGAHLPAGYTYWALGDYRLNPEHPPLVKLLAAAPLRALPVTMHEDDAAWIARRQWELGRRFLYHWNDADRLLLYGRLPIVLLGALLAALTYAATHRLFGPAAAAVALLLCVLSPDVLAHGQLVTTDLALALFSFATVLALARCRERAGAAPIAALCACFALMCAAKFSALLFAPILAVVAFAPRGRPRLAPAFGVAALMLLSAWVALWACYGFRFAASPDPRQTFDWSRVQPESWWIAAPLRAARFSRVLPEALLYGFLRFFKAQEMRPAFLLGRLSTEGWWYYFPATFVLKTPMPLLLLVAAAAVRAMRRREPTPVAWLLWAPPLLYTSLVMTRSLNIGHRHLLPIYPYLFVLAGGAGAAGLAHVRRGVRVLTGALLAWYAIGTVRVHPHYLAYFNELAGGPANGYRLLVDSNLDWGQDLKGLKAWMDEHHVGEIKLSYFGTADPEYYGIRCERLPGQLRPPRVAAEVHAGDWVAISATNLQGVYLREDERRFMERFRAEAPVDSVGYSILLYRAPADLAVPQGGEDDYR